MVFNPSMIAPVASIFGAIMGMNAGSQVEEFGRQQAIMAEKNALLAKRELQEQVRRQAAEDQRLRSAALARGAASGAKVSGSVATYLAHMEDEQTRQLDWLKSSGASRIRLDLEAGMSRARATETRGQTQKISSLFTGATQAFSHMDRAGFFTKDKTV